MIRSRSFPLFCLAALLFAQCGYAPENASTPAASPIPTLASNPLTVGFQDYWYQGKAELSSYTVTQERYGEIRPAEQVNIFVTEDFSRQKQVKLDNPDQAGNDRVPVLKLNSVRRFHTGIYDYSILESVFTPVDNSATLKTTSTVQDWCGQVFTQINLEKKDYRIRQFSYFETEGDTDERLPQTLLEDELWTKLRIDPAALPLGKVQIIPATLYLRFRHQPFKTHSANLALEKGDRESTLRLTYADIPRSLAIRFESASPYRILGWEELDNGKLMSKGVLKTTRMEAYWSEHDVKHDGMRDSLQVTF